MLVTFTAMPVSTTHSIVGGTVGAAAVGVGFNCLNWDWESGGLSAIIASWVILRCFPESSESSRTGSRTTPSLNPNSGVRPGATP